MAPEGAACEAEASAVSGACAEAEYDAEDAAALEGAHDGTYVPEELFPLETLYHWWERFENNRLWMEQQKERAEARKREQLLKKQEQGVQVQQPAHPSSASGIPLRHFEAQQPLFWGSRISGSRAPVVFLQAPTEESQELAKYLRSDPLGPFIGGILEWTYSSHWDWERWGFREDKEKVYKADWFAVPSTSSETEVFVPRMAKMDMMKRAPPRVEAFAEAFRAVNREAWSIIHDTLAGMKAQRECESEEYRIRNKGKVLDEVAESFLEHSHFGTIEAQIRWGDSKLRLPSHKDGATSLLHLGFTLGGKRTFRAGVFPSSDMVARSEENVWDESIWNQEHLREVHMQPGSCYLTSPFCFEHGVEYQETIQHDPVIALQFRFAFRGNVGPDVNAIRNDREMLDITTVIAGVLKVAGDHGFVRLPSMDEVKAAENRLAAAARRAQRNKIREQEALAAKELSTDMAK